MRARFEWKVELVAEWQVATMVTSVFHERVKVVKTNASTCWKQLLGSTAGLPASDGNLQFRP